MSRASSFKRAIPQVADQVRRDGLLDTLAKARAKSALTWVVGLPGSGKTSLVARFVAESSEPCFWYRLDSQDADVAPLFDALSQAFGPKLSLPVWSPENQADLGDFTRDFFAELGREPLTIVLDDCHRIPDSSPTLTMLEHARDVAAEVRVVMVSRRPPPPAIARGVLGGWVSLVDDLRLSSEEAASIARAARGAELSKADIAALAHADGWLARVLAATRSRAHKIDLPSVDAHVGEFLAAELLASVPDAQRAGLRRLAELPEIPKQLPARSLAPEIARLLSTLSAQGYFVDFIDGRWRLHDLLRDSLRALNAHDDDLATLRAARRQLADDVSEPLPEAAMQLRVDAEDVDGVLHLLDLHGTEWLARGLHRTVNGWLAGLAEPDQAEKQARFASWRAQAILPLEPEAARPLFAKARRLARELANAELAYASWCGEVSSYVVQWGAVHGLADLVDDLEALAKELGPPSGDLAFRTNADALTALMYGRAEDRRIARYADATAKALAHAPDAGARIAAAGQLLIYRLWWAGDYPGGRALYHAFDEEVRTSEELPPLARLIWWSCAAIVDWQCGDSNVCYDKVERGLALAAASGVHIRDFFLLTQGIFCALSQEDWGRAERYLTALARTERTYLRLDAMVHHFFRSWYCLCRGDAATALAHAETAWPMAEAMGSMFHKVIVLSALAPARVHSGDIEGAEKAYRAQLALAKEAQNPTFSFIAFCSGAEIAFARNDADAARKQVERMLFAKHLGGFHTGCGWRTPMMQKVLAFAVANDVGMDVARQWIEEKKIPAPDEPPAGWPMPVRLRALDGLVVELSSDPAPDARGGKSSQKLRELLAVLIAERGGATLSDVGDWLWPDAEGDKASASLKVAIHRLRQWLGQDAVRVQDGRVRLNPSQVACDVWGNLAGEDPSRVLHGLDLPPVFALRKRLERKRLRA